MMTLKLGSRGNDVKTLQEKLNLIADGIFGTGTEKAVKLFQAEHGLVADGIVGNKTWEALGITSNNSNIVALPNDLVIENKFLNPGLYLTGNYTNDYIILHHTAGWDNPSLVIDSWNTDTQGRICTEFVVGGLRSTDGRNTYDGQIIRSFPEGNQGYHIGKCGSAYMTTHSVGIELCNMGWVNKGKTYVNTNVIPELICTLSQPFRGYTQWHKYSDEQLKSLKKLLLYIANRDNIDLHKGLYEWIKKEGINAFEFHEEAYYGKIKKAMYTHANIRKDKFDCFPQPELIDMVLSL